MTTKISYVIITVTLVRPEIAASSIGSGYYEACLAFHTTTNKVGATF